MKIAIKTAFGDRIGVVRCYIYKSAEDGTHYIGIDEARVEPLVKLEIFEPDEVNQGMGIGNDKKMAVIGEKSAMSLTDGGYTIDQMIYSLMAMRAKLDGDAKVFVMEPHEKRLICAVDGMFINENNSVIISRQ